MATCMDRAGITTESHPGPRKRPFPYFRRHSAFSDEYPLR